MSLSVPVAIGVAVVGGVAVVAGWEDENSQHSHENTKKKDVEIELNISRQKGYGMVCLFAELFSEILQHVET